MVTLLDLISLQEWNWLFPSLKFLLKVLALEKNLVKISNFLVTIMQSKWLVAALFGIIFLWRHDAEALWAASGSVLNSALSTVLKRILNQERPVSTIRSDPGMPSSHAQSIFYTVTFCIVSSNFLSY